ncbi:MAG: hydrogenase maturation protease [Verrucomicrobiales bacterium]|nr:hydrogenase maturation protease [Verrucomicrobiales bacterium]
MSGDANNLRGAGGKVGEMLVIGYGNPMRGDDGVGPAVADAISRLGLGGLRVETRHQLTPELEALLGEVEAAVFVDAVDPEDGDAGGIAGSDGVRVRVRELRGEAHRTPEWTGHRFDPEGLLALTRELRGRAPKAWCVEIPVREFGWGPGLGSAAREQVPEAVAAVRRLWEQHACTRRV